MNNVLWSLVSLAMVTVLSGAALAQTPTCDKLPKDKRALADGIMAKEHPYDCCDDTIAKCLGKKPVCRLVQRLAEDICRRVADGEDEQTIRRGLAKRARSMMSRKRVKIDLAGVPVAGSPSAPVTVVTYACSRCPYCSKLIPKVHESVTKGALKGKAKLYFKQFPIRSHEFSKEGGLALVAAAKLGKFWEMVLQTYAHFDDFCVLKLPEWAEMVGMDPAEFKKTMADPVTRTLLVESKKEGIVNKVNATPTFFINGVEYTGDLHFEELEDVLLEAYDKAAGKKYL